MRGRAIQRGESICCTTNWNDCSPTIVGVRGIGCPSPGDQDQTVREIDQLYVYLFLHIKEMFFKVRERFSPLNSVEERQMYTYTVQVLIRFLGARSSVSLPPDNIPHPETCDEGTMGMHISPHLNQNSHSRNQEEQPSFPPSRFPAHCARSPRRNQISSSGTLNIIY